MDTPAGGKKISRNLIGAVFGLGFVGLGGYIWTSDGKFVASLVTIGMGGVVAAAALAELKKNLTNLSDPVGTMLKYELQDPRTIGIRLLGLVLFDAVIFAVAALTSSVEAAVRAVVQIVTGPPVGVIFLLVVHLAIIWGMLFSSTYWHRE